MVEAVTDTSGFPRRSSRGLRPVEEYEEGEEGEEGDVTEGFALW